MSARLVGFGSAAILAAIMFLPASASAGPAGFVNLSADVSVIQNVGYEKRHWRRYHRDYDDDDDGPAYVRAPFTEVDTHRGTWVAAPFVRVYNGRYGTWVRAPFVNRWVPR